MTIFITQIVYEPKLWTSLGPNQKTIRDSRQAECNSSEPCMGSKVQNVTFVKKFNTVRIETLNNAQYGSLKLKKTIYVQIISWSFRYILS